MSNQKTIVNTVLIIGNISSQFGNQIFITTIDAQLAHENTVVSIHWRCINKGFYENRNIPEWALDFSSCSLWCKAITLLGKAIVCY